MEVSAKVKELEDEVKVLKAEIRNVLLDIREAILDRTNPLSDGGESAYLRMDLNTTARAFAAEQAARAVSARVQEELPEEPIYTEPEEPDAGVSAGPPPQDEALQETADEEPTESEPEQPEATLSPDPAPADEDLEEEAEVEPVESEPEEIEAGLPPGLPPEDEAVAEETEGEPEQRWTDDSGGFPPNGEAFLKGKAPSGIPPMYFPPLFPAGATGSLAAWVTNALATLGPQDLERVITIHRLWGSLPPNISYALAHLQRLIRSSKEEEPPWLKAMQELERLASC
ncbi:MAG: hypothetical protein ACUVV3_01975 [Dehalococcoidia bacterium]